MEYYYIVGSDCAIRRSGKVVQQPVFDGPHNDENDAYTVASRIVVAGEYQVISSPHGNREKARQEFNHEQALEGGAGKALVNRWRLEPKKRSDLAAAKAQRKLETEQAWQ